MTKEASSGSMWPPWLRNLRERKGTKLWVDPFSEPNYGLTPFLFSFLSAFAAEKREGCENL